MFLIMSGAYVGQELRSEFGKIPPSFLPLGNRRLYQHQISLAPVGVDVYISIPETFNLSTTDKEWFKRNNVNVIKTSDSLSLGGSLVAAVNISGHPLNGPLHVLFGDTLYRKLPVGENVAGTSNAKDGYNWAIVSDNKFSWLKSDNSSFPDRHHKIIDGYFKFSRPRELIKSITQSEWKFLEGLNRYNSSIGMTLLDSDGWLDFGHVNTYYRSKAHYTTQRAFNELIVSPEWVEKSSSKDEKIAAEAFWFENIPADLRGYTPQYLGAKYEKNKTSYRLEFLHLTALNELYVFSKLPSKAWDEILNSCVSFLSCCSGYKNNEIANSLDTLFKDKTTKRLAIYCSDTNITLDQTWSYNGEENVSLNSILNDINKYIPEKLTDNTIMHGDFCFSNILYDFRAGRIKTIDPRGLTLSGDKTIYGDLRYDIAKLSHSVLGLYDWIIAGFYDVEIYENNIHFSIVEDSQHKEIQQLFMDIIAKKFDLTAKNLYAMQIHLFLSMLPLHSDDPRRQNALFANSFRLHQILKRLK